MGASVASYFAAECADKRQRGCRRRSLRPPPRLRQQCWVPPLNTLFEKTTSAGARGLRLVELTGVRLTILYERTRIDAFVIVVVDEQSLSMDANPQNPGSWTWI